MALVELYHVVAASRAVASGATIKEGMIVGLNASGEVVVQGDGTADWAYGIAGDTKSTTASSMPGVASGWQNRASDYFDETKASAKITVYHSGGEFATDQYNTTNVTDSSVPGTVLYGSATGILDTADPLGTAQVVAVLLKAAGAYPSGVPGVDINGDIALGSESSNEYIEVKLMI